MLNDVRQHVTTCPGIGQVTTPGASCNMHDRPLGYSYRVISHALELYMGIMEHSEETSAYSKQ